MKDGTCFITLICSLDQPGEDVQYSWDTRGQGAVVSHGGTTLSVSWRSGVSDSYHCTVKNPISQSSSSIPVRPLCSGNRLLLRALLSQSRFSACLPVFLGVLGMIEEKEGWISLQQGASLGWQEVRTLELCPPSVSPVPRRAAGSAG